ncbi:diguanylate cyclase/phosphodiesterase (GGDEF & EAL domains) with PAS/PAC sensor(s) [hydrothermal vent metagenome]|uniref:Diguanylate cyclase/phosphodiesterase (GGDEF & EAL domains) with PAS/PAC sensor(S) n=1 Tax=hydrothermal vent metagenome TaxID=652676 RepID=A0A3B0ZDM1_9ZZZZ
MIIGSIVLLFSSLNPVKKICQYEDQKHLGWAGLQHLILFFIAGHIIFGYYLVTSEVAFIHTIIAMVFLGGGWFVSVVCRLNLGNIERFNKAVQIERHRALHDPLTALPNRILFHERIDHALSFAKREQKEIALMIIDLNEFKEVNDSLGHQAGDKLLLLASQRLKEVLRESDTLARFGGDEFAVILPQSSKRQADVLAKRLTMAIHHPFNIEDCTLTIGMSVGIAMYPSHGHNSEALIKHADQEMYRAKKDQKAFLATDNKADDTLHIDLVSAVSTAKKQGVQNEKRLLN